MTDFLSVPANPFAHHIHIYTCIEGAGRNGLKVADAMFYHFGYAGEVGHYKAVEAPLLAEQSVISHLLAVAGTPSISLKEAITLPTPASTAAS